MSESWRTDGRRAAGFRRAKALRKLTDQDAASIRSQLAAGASKADLSRQFGVSRKAVYLIAINRTYQTKEQR